MIDTARLDRLARHIVDDLGRRATGPPGSASHAQECFSFAESLDLDLEDLVTLLRLASGEASEGSSAILDRRKPATLPLDRLADTPRTFATGDEPDPAPARGIARPHASA